MENPHWHVNRNHLLFTVHKMGLILRSLERRPQMKFSMSRKFILQLLRRYNVKHSKTRNFMLDAP
jgi:hypothetical protein